MCIIINKLFVESIRMKKNILYKLFALAFVFVLFCVQSFAKSEDNLISKIIIDSTSNTNYSLNLLFNNEFKGSAFLHKVDPGVYYVFLPETAVNGRNPQIIYKKKSDRERINLKVDSKTYVKDKKDSNYVRVTVNMADDYSIKLISGLVSDYKGGILPYGFDILSIIMIGLLVVAGILIAKVFKQCRKEETSTYKAPRSFAYLKAQTEYLEEMKRRADESVQQAKIQRENLKNSIKPVEKNSFDCFELPYVEETTNGVNYELKSTIRQASKLLKEKPSLVKLRHTNPITRANTTTASGLQMPAAEDVIKPKKKTISVPTETKQEASAELLSILNITPNKGFYLTTVEDTLALFGFVNDEVFLFNKFKDLGQINLQARYYDKNGGNDIYIVRLDNYKAMIEISDTSMRELAKI